MKALQYIFLTALFLQSFSCKAQTIYVQESVVIDQTLPRTSKSYKTHILKICDTDTTCISCKNCNYLWQPLDAENLICSNIRSIVKVNINSKKADTIFISSKYLTGLAANYPFCYFVEIDNEFARYSSAMLYRLDLRNNDTIKINLGNIRSIEQINISPNGNHLSFVEYSNYESYDNVLYNYCILNTENQYLSIIDSAFRIKDEHYGGIDDGRLSYWINNEDFVFYKQSEGNEDNLYTYNLKWKSLRFLMRVPVDHLRSYAFFKNHFCFISKGDSLVQYIEENKYETLYKVNSKHDYLDYQFYIIGSSKK